MKIRQGVSLGFVALLLLVHSRAVWSAEGPSYGQSVTQAVQFLTSRQNDDGSFSREAGPAVTALVTTALLRHGRPAEDSVVAQGLEYVLSHVQSDGGIYQVGSKYRNYETCLAMMCLAAANSDGRYDATIQAAGQFVKTIQWDEGEGKTSPDLEYGGAGYGSHGRPDLSNTSFLVDALIAAGEDADSEAIQRALMFVSRCQNLESPENTSPFPSKVNDGGFYYTCAAGGSSQAGTTENGGLRSYASMTYAGLKSMIYAGVGPEDARVKAAVDWLQGNYDLESNPGMGDSGLYYYYHTFAKALDAFGQDRFVDEAGVAHDWREELRQELISRQRLDGSWLNSNERWLEGNPDLVTGYALLALSYVRP